MPVNCTQTHSLNHSDPSPSMVLVPRVEWLWLRTSALPPSDATVSSATTALKRNSALNADPRKREDPRK